MDEPVLEAGELPPARKRVPPRKKDTSDKRTKVTEVTQPAPPKDEKPDVTLDSDDTSGKFTALEGAKVLMDVMATIHEGRENYCCAEMYRRQKLPVAVSLNELAKDSPMLQSWITHGKAFKVIALVAAMEPLVEHQWRGHLRPSIQQRRQQQLEAYYQEHPEEAPAEFWESQDIYVPEPHEHTLTPEPQVATVVEQPWRGGPTVEQGKVDKEAPPSDVKPEFVPGEGVRGGNGAIIPIPQRG